MIVARTIIIPILVTLALTVMISDVDAVELYENQELRTQPRIKADVAGLAQQGNVTVVERKGYWVKIKSGKLVGWTKLNNVKMKETIVWMSPIDTLHDTGRLAAGH